jgi:REP element-mobilizing transposase RayT
MPNIITEYPQFVTITNLEWKKLLKPGKYKDIVIDSFRFLVKEKRIILYAFVIMDNHLHLIWQMQAGIKAADVQRDLLKYAAQQIKRDLAKNHPQVLERFKVNAKDRRYQFWERNALSIELSTEKVFQQKLNYIHENPVRAGLCKLPEEYHYSSASLYELNKTEWEFLTHSAD